MTTSEEFLTELAGLIEIDPAAITRDTQLASLPSWDSLAIISFMALVQERFGFTVSGDGVQDAATAGQLLDLIEARRPAGSRAA